MAGASTHDDVLSRVRREQRIRGRADGGSGLRIVLMATGITVAILLFAFGAIGMLMLARSPQEPIVSKLDATSPFAQQNEAVTPAPQVELDPLLKQEPETKTVKTLRVIAPAHPPEKQETVAQQQQVPSQEPETTATIPAAPQQQQQVQQQVPQRVHQQRHVQQQPARRPIPNSQADNPLFQLFGIKQYR